MSQENASDAEVVHTDGDLPIVDDDDGLDQQIDAKDDASEASDFHREDLAEDLEKETPNRTESPISTKDFNRPRRRRLDREVDKKAIEGIDREVQDKNDTEDAVQSNSEIDDRNETRNVDENEKRLVRSLDAKRDRKSTRLNSSHT
mgnify:CR=1 FL=1